MPIEFYFTVASGRLNVVMPGDVAYMLPASSWSRDNMRKPNLPRHVKRVAADCGGFVATRIWGDYRYTPDEYVKWLETFNPVWAATMDYCCEDELTSQKHGIIRERQNKTTEMAYQFWRDYPSTPWQWVVTIQGWNTEDYVYHARQLKPLLNDMRKIAGNEWRIGIGTLCNRASAKVIQEVVYRVSEVLSDPLHLWGVKLSVLKSPLLLKNVVSVDSAVWHGGFASDSKQKRAEMKRYGLSQREHDYLIALPRYRRKVERTADMDKQMRLF